MRCQNQCESSNAVQRGVCGVCVVRIRSFYYDRVEWVMFVIVSLPSGKFVYFGVVQFFLIYRKVFCKSYQYIVWL